MEFKFSKGYIRFGMSEAESQKVDTAINVEGGSAYGLSFRGHKSPTGNCQTFSLAFMNNILDKVKKNEEIIEVVQRMAQYYSKYQCLCDVTASLGPKMDQVFGAKVIVKTPYKSTNGSSMILYLLDARN